jgi:plasmid stabilization system protein ParE
VASVRLLRRAEVDLEEAVGWYEARSPQAARRFEGAAAAAIERIAARPELYALADERHRLCPIRRSQYLIVYRYEPTNEEVLIVAVAHVSQDPPAWQSRA